ncbi:lipopolysaccharide biosynthesis protein [Natronoarchaeum rubrum]|uniref:lipopolysaccharide biosynthesis protein n=1 Tax=Natronoarchaeum rubrum TaxID=755311 RepID=UPI00211183AA|nr:oligosaccharide flippase family protein [Natronoarchaeum rubrum]
MSGEDTHELDLGREAMVGFASNAAMMAFGFAGVVLFARVLGPAGLGAYYLVLAGGRTLSQLSNGVGAAVKKRASEADTDPRAFLGVGLLAHLAVSVAVAVLAVLFGPLIERVVDVPRLAVSVSAIVFSLGLFQICNELYAGIGKPGYASWADTVRSMLTLLLQVAFILLDWGPFGLVVAFAAASFISGVGVWVASGVVPRLPSRETVESTATYARWSVPDNIVSDLYGRADIIIVGIFAGNTAVGFYETAVRLVQPGAFFATSISGPLTVKVSGLSSRNHKIIPDLKNAMSYAGLLAVPIFFGATAMSTEIMQTVFGSEFTGAGSALIGLAVFQILNGYAKPFESVISGSDRIRLQFGVSVVVVVVHLPLAIALGSIYGLEGVIASTVFAEVLRLSAYQLLTRRLFKEFVAPRPVAAQLVSGALMGILVFVVVETIVAIRGWPSLLLLVAVGATVYFTALGMISSHFRVTLNNVLRPVVNYSE